MRSRLCVALVLALLVVSQSQAAFHPPVPGTPLFAALLPAANVEQVTFSNTFGNVDVYNVNPPLVNGGTQISVPKGTALDQVQRRAAAASSSMKILFPPYCDAGDNQRPFVVQQAQRFWAINLLPLFGIH